MENQKPRIIVICGPTGIGKTGAAIDAALTFGGEIVSADSMQIYRYMDIGTAKPTAEEKAAMQHHMIDIVDPDEDFDAAQYAEEARRAVAQIHKKGKVPFVAGGTGLYIKILLGGIFQAPAPAPELRARLRAEAKMHGAAFLHQRLLGCDPESGRRIHPNDTFRIVRALEIFETTGQSISEYHQSHGFSENPFHVYKIGLQAEREILYKRIEMRVDAMLETGLESEVRSLLEKGYSPQLKSMQSIGYRHMADWIQGRLSFDEAVRTMKQDTRRYAKRQFTWFRADPEIVWTEVREMKNLYPEIKKFLQNG
ncbi:MAG: tRNA (adenosine(37)-N6)-dimethylallyltransferase MiaA [Desulfobacterales bacterium]